VLEEHVYDPDELDPYDALHDDLPPDANNNASTSMTVNAIAYADVKIIDQAWLLPPTEINVSAQVPVILRKVLHNNGPYADPVEVTVTKVATAPPDCTINPPGDEFQVVLPVSVDVVIDEEFTIHCSKPSDHTFNVVNHVSGPKDVHIIDPDPSNNVASTDLTVGAIGSADLKVISWAFPDDLKWPPAVGPAESGVQCKNAVDDDADTVVNDGCPDIPGNQILVAPGVPNPVVAQDVVHNNGPYGPVSAWIDLSAVDVSGVCDVEPNLQTRTIASMPVSVDVAHPDAFTVDWTDLKKPPYSCDLAFSKKIGTNDVHIDDPDAGNNIVDVLVTLVRDTDDDGVPDNYAGIRDNCQDVKNADQKDTDGDGLGDLCDSTPDHELKIKYCLKFGPAPVNLSDTQGAYMWVICEIGNLDAYTNPVTIDLVVSGVPAGCDQNQQLVLPGLHTFKLTALEQKWVLFRERYECHQAPQNIYPLDVSFCIEPTPSIPFDDDGDTVADEDPIDGWDNDADSLIDEDPPEGTGPPVCHEQTKLLIVHQVAP
jgi:hypothetical protein